MRGRMTRRITAALTAAVLLALAACSGAGGPQEIRFTFSKREAISFMNDVVAEYNQSQDQVRVVMDTSGVDVVSASFVRGNPPDLMLANYNFEVARFVQRCALIDLSETEAASLMRDDLQPLMDQYGVCEGRTPALPYSVMAASVIYNKEIFAEHDLEVPQTWSELLEVADTLQEAGVDPFYGTFADPWTINQGWFDYTVGGSLDVLEFFDRLAEQGTDVGPDSPVSFQQDFLEPVEKMVYLAQNYTNSDAGSRTYDAGNVAFANGAAAMYLQGPWALGEIALTSPDLEVGSFPLPMTEDPEDLRVRVNMDLAAMIPEGADHPEEALDFLEYLFQPEIITAYNESQLGFVPQEDGAEPTDPRVEGMIEYYEQGQVYQGPGVLIPAAIPNENYAQAIILGADPATQLAVMDEDWARVVFREPAPARQTEEDRR
ncbi:ABC transporter substrate-binding protein [Bogoriella caseilytica]|uniref:Carbohydrate ABC transporter substrate-binding protein (CUT1 family) n=1 Tax=Bogoriella caseilytica TaxID=56055 RepID=A0A3N2BDI9_9MICO|nr:extracellular solute-binding protein [Bogoriella caseilytica]ROR73317.1 carbohydrate ABC transporter substrate-binding protein (CUT1 family) [Bogoriella caseilytica]